MSLTVKRSKHAYKGKGVLQRGTELLGEKGDMLERRIKRAGREEGYTDSNENLEKGRRKERLNEI